MRAIDEKNCCVKRPDAHKTDARRTLRYSKGMPAHGSGNGIERAG